MTFTGWTFPNVSSSDCAWLSINVCTAYHRSISPSCAVRLRMLPDAVNYVLLVEDFRTFEFSSLQHVKLWSTCVLFRRSLRLELTSWAYAAININSCLQALTKDISTPADIAPSTLETTILYCFTGYISALTYYYYYYLLASFALYDGVPVSICRVLQ